MTSKKRRGWNPLEMDTMQASNLALIVGMCCVVFYVVMAVAVGVTPNAALLGLIGTGLIAQRWMVGRERRDDDDTPARTDQGKGTMAAPEATGLPATEAHRDAGDGPRRRGGARSDRRLLVPRFAR